MAATIQVVPYTHLHRRLIQWYVKGKWNCTTSFKEGDLDPFTALKWRANPVNFSQGQPSPSTVHNTDGNMDASLEGWGGHTKASLKTLVLFHGLGDQEERSLHINILELRVVRMTLTQHTKHL